MVDAKKKEDKDKKEDGEDKKDDKDAKEEKTVVVPLPPLEAASRRLERLLGGGLSDADRKVYTFSNPVKVVRRWLGTASGASGKATTEDIVKAAAVLLDPSSESAKGREILVALAPDVVASLEKAKAATAAAAAAAAAKSSSGSNSLLLSSLSSLMYFLFTFDVAVVVGFVVAILRWRNFFFQHVVFIIPTKMVQIRRVVFCYTDIF